MNSDEEKSCSCRLNCLLIGLYKTLLFTRILPCLYRNGGAMDELHGILLYPSHLSGLSNQ